MNAPLPPPPIFLGHAILTRIGAKKARFVSKEIDWAGNKKTCRATYARQVDVLIDYIRRNEMEDPSMVYKLLARAFLDIHISASEGRSEAAFNIADLFHNIPYQLKRIQDNSGDFIEIVDWLKMRAEQKGMSTWIENALRECNVD